MEYKYVILGSKGHGKTTLHSAIRKVKETLKKENISIYPDNISGNYKVHELIPILEQTETIILVVSAAQGLNPDTRGYALLSRQFGIKNIIVYINKADQVGNENLYELQKEILDLMAEYDYCEDNLLVYSGSAIKVLEDACDECVDKEVNTILKLLS